MLASGCATVSDVARETAAHDLNCPQDQVSSVLVGSYFARPVRYVATGCGLRLKYACYPIGKADFKCFPDQPPRPEPFDNVNVERLVIPTRARILAAVGGGAD